MAATDVGVMLTFVLRSDQRVTIHLNSYSPLETIERAAKLIAEGIALATGRCQIAVLRELKAVHGAVYNERHGGRVVIFHTNGARCGADNRNGVRRQICTDHRWRDQCVFDDGPDGV